MNRLALIFIIFCLCACGSSSEQNSAVKVEAAKANPKAFPFNVALQSTDGVVHHSAEVLPQNGKPTVLLFWLTTCQPCKRELAAIEKEYGWWKEETDFNLVAISTDWEKNYPNLVKRVADYNWDWEAYWDKDRAFKKVLPGELNGLPQTFVFDADGKMVYHHRKYSSGDEHNLYAAVKEAAEKS